MADKERIDLLLVSKGLAESRSLAQKLVMAGQVRVDGQLVHKPSRRVSTLSILKVEGGPKYVSRGGQKLEGAIGYFDLKVEGLLCADVGASTGGFTDCLLQHGARKVYSIDVGHGLLHWDLRNDPRIVVMERTNARKLGALPQPIDLVTIDSSFISLQLLLPNVVRWLSPEANVIALVKPQFEAGREFVRKGGVVRDPDVHRKVLENVLGWCSDLGLFPQDIFKSPLVGPKGNVEFFVWAATEGVANELSDRLDEIWVQKD